jgi:polar amino acid transport system substrate-binding protein
MLEDGKVIGIGTDKVREIMARTAMAYQIELLPWKRAYDSALQVDNTCVYSTTRTAERERLFKWVGPVAISEWVMFGRADRKFDLKSLEDVRALRIGTYNGDVRDSYLRSRGFEVDTATDDVNNPKKLLADRIDLWASGKFEGRAVLKQNGWEAKVVPVLAFNKADLYLACNRSIPDEVIERLNAALAAMGRDGTTKVLERKYEGWPN